MRDDELIIDSFAGGGGASLGIAQALGRSPDVAINHDADAIAMHAANHPETRHLTEDVWNASPRKVTRGRPVGLLWASPDCRDFSRAKGGQPVKKEIRGLAWSVVRWAVETSPRVIILENVREFQEWGPLVPRWACAGCGWKGTEGQAVLARDRRRCPRCNSLRLKQTEDMVRDPERLGLTFKRFVGRLKNLGYQAKWRVLDAADYGAPTHRKRLFLVARNDGEPVVWPEPTHGDPRTIGTGLFDQHLRPWRTAAECIDWSIPCPSIFTRKRPLAGNTLRRIALGVKRYVLDNPSPFLVVCNHAGSEFRGQGVNEPLPTLTAARDAHGLVVPALVQTGYGERNGQKPRVLDIHSPMGTLVSGCKQALVAAFLAKHYGGVVGHSLGEPTGTVTAKDHHSLVAANLVHMNHGDKQWSGADEPLRTVTTGNHAALVYSFLTKYFQTAIGQSLNEPLHTVTANDRFGLVTVTVGGEPYVIVDIGMRMLSPRELARGQGFPDTYLLTGTKMSQVERIGNSVSPCVARAVVAANCVQAVAEASR